MPRRQFVEVCPTQSSSYSALVIEPQLTRTADALCLDEAYERDLYYTAFGTEEKARGVEGFLSRKRAKANATASQSAQNTE